MNCKLAIVPKILLLLGSEIAFAQNFQWQPIGPWGGWMDDVAIAPSETNVLYARQGLSALKSNDLGINWTATTPVNRVDDRPIQGLYGITVHPDFSNRIYLGGGEMLCYSRDGGESWECSASVAR